jgi:hypothetical protein
MVTMWCADEDQFTADDIHERFDSNVLEEIATTYAAAIVTPDGSDVCMAVCDCCYVSV